MKLQELNELQELINLIDSRLTNIQLNDDETFTMDVFEDTVSVILSKEAEWLLVCLENINDRFSFNVVITVRH